MGKILTLVPFFLPIDLTPLSATVIFVIACLAGISYRRVWKNEGPRWQLWLFGAVAGFCLLAVAFTPMATGSP